jgi:hypothetical protein
MADEPTPTRAAPEPTQEPPRTPEGNVPPEPAEPAREPESGRSDDVPESTRAARREAAGYRTRLRDAEATSARLAARVDRQDREAVERAAGEALMAEPADLWLAADLSRMRGEDGELDDARVRAEVERVLAEKPHWRTRTADFRPGVRPPSGHGGGSFGERLKRAVSGGQ